MYIIPLSEDSVHPEFIEGISHTEAKVSASAPRARFLLTLKITNSQQSADKSWHESCTNSTEKASAKIRRIIIT